MLEAIIALIFEHPVPLALQPRLFCFYSLFEFEVFVSPSYPHLVVRVGSVYRVSKQRYEPRLRDNLCSPSGSMRVRQVVWSTLTGYDPLPVLPLGLREAATVPLGAQVEQVVEEVQ